ncbi:Catechol 2,3-dioxygenase [Methylobacterium sp. 174MFSha1.1]|uniref:VOC family protein n=1 Tax=Methylobacterium sp. 174MFSha1.1 TaxID=1502749 RepID=UPI0008E0A43F|nr:VOC family protein [Methylobacterium sp. 174MFSha1.1]SFU64731.1 Catechol 2,3-dioxygenase [Methylobacterium sp. 174MFSha1.1]
MLDHLAVDVSDLDRSRRFYAAALAPLGYAVTRDGAAAVGFGVAAGKGRSRDPGGDFWIAVGAPPAPQIHFAFSASSRAAVDAFFAAALAAGGVDNGRPGLRPRYHENYYAAFVIDPDGYNIEAVCHVACD